jgi:hypothetical protein
LQNDATIPERMETFLRAMCQIGSENPTINTKIEIPANKLPKKSVIEHLALWKNDGPFSSSPPICKALPHVPEGICCFPLRVMHHIGSENPIIHMKLDTSTGELPKKPAGRHLALEK